MKTYKLIFFFVLLSTLGVNAQEPICEGVDTTHWKKINTIPIDYGFKCIDVDYSKFYSINPYIKIFTHLKWNKKSGCNEYKSIDFKKYNIISFYSRVGSCKHPFVRYSLFETGTQEPFLKITIFQFGTCKNSVGITFDCLVLKKDCPIKTRVCITRKIIEEKRL